MASDNKHAAETGGGRQLAPPLAPSTSTYLFRYPIVVRITHWVAVACMYLLLLSGFQIFNAHPALYWGEQSDFDHPVLKMTARSADDGRLEGVTSVFEKEFDTTGMFGASAGDGAQLERRGFPRWLTIPGPQWLAMGRRWHFFFGWIFVMTGLIYWGFGLWSGHFRRNLLPDRADWRGIGKSIVDHALLRRPHGEEAARYNVLQKLSYLAVVFGLAPLIVLTGLCMSPRMDVALGWLVSALGGRQSARTWHFLITAAFVLFTLVHVFQIVLTGPLKNLRSMLTGYFEVDLPQANSDVTH